MSMKEEYTAIDMSTAAADGFRDGQSAAQSAPAGQREAFDKWFRAEQLIADHIDTTFISSAFLPYKAFQAGASWQRTQAAGVPEGWKIAPTDDGDGFIVSSPRIDCVASHTAVFPDDNDPAHKLLWAMLAAAPAQPAAQSELPAEVIAAAIRSVPAWSEISADLLAWEIFDYLYPGQKRKTVNGHYINCNAVSQYPAGKCNCGKGE